MEKLTRIDIIYLIIIIVVIIGSFALLLHGQVLPAWLVGTISSLLTGILGISIGTNNNE